MAAELEDSDFSDEEGMDGDPSFDPDDRRGMGDDDYEPPHGGDDDDGGGPGWGEEDELDAEEAVGCFVCLSTEARCVHTCPCSCQPGLPAASAVHHAHTIEHTPSGPQAPVHACALFTCALCLLCVYMLVQVLARAASRKRSAPRPRASTPPQAPKAPKRSHKAAPGKASRSGGGGGGGSSSKSKSKSGGGGGGGGGGSSKKKKRAHSSEEEEEDQADFSDEVCVVLVEVKCANPRDEACR
eukprot:1161859-Pelagomonas_calceolata.AAC.6